MQQNEIDSNEAKMSVDETIQLIKEIALRSAHPSFSKEVEQALAELDELRRDGSADEDSLVYTYYSTLGQVVTRSTIIASMEAFSSEVQNRIKSGMIEEDAVKSVMEEAGLAGTIEKFSEEIKAEQDVAGAVDVSCNI